MTFKSYTENAVRSLVQFCQPNIVIRNYAANKPLPVHMRTRRAVDLERAMNLQATMLETPAKYCESLIESAAR